MHAITTLYASDRINQQYTRTLNAIASGSRLNPRDENPADVAVSASLGAQTAQLSAVTGNVQSVVSLAQTQQGFLQGIQSQLSQLSVVAQEASGNALGSGAQQDYQTEFNNLVGQINQIASNASIDGVPLFSGQTVPLSVSAGGGAVDQFVLSTIGSATSLGLDSASVATPASAANAVSLINVALSCVGSQIATVAADVSKFNFYAANAANAQTNLGAADDTISDADVATKSTNLSTQDILRQTATVAQVHANHDAKYVLNLLTPLAVSTSGNQTS